MGKRAQKWRTFREMVDAMNSRDDAEGKTDVHEPEEVSEGQIKTKRKKNPKVEFQHGSED